jgi:F-type H+-transporting ATPase subunit b
MHIDWFVFFAQIVNFLILLFLLKKFLYGRIIGAIDSREAKIQSTFSEAERIREEAEKSAVLCRKQLQELECASNEMMKKAKADAEAFRKELLENVRQEVELIQLRWIETLRLERGNFFHELRRLTGVQVYAVTRRVLKDLADMDVERRMIQILMERVAALNADERGKIKALVKARRTIIIQSAFDVRPDILEELHQHMEGIIGPGIDVAHEKSSDILSGCELRINGFKIAWSIKDYLDTLEESFNRLLSEELQGSMEGRRKEG